MRSFLLVIILALLLQCQGVPIEDFFIVDGSSSNSPDQELFDDLSTSCGGVSRLNVCFTSHISFNCQANFSFVMHIDDIGSTGRNS